MHKPWDSIKTHDPEVYNLIESELKRQQFGLELIASENFASEQVISCMGSILTNKYAEGRPGKRYYGGCQEVDKIENLAIDRACKLFDAKFANVQPHSGSQANAAAFLALAKAGDRILGLDLSHGGHLTHGSPVNFSGLLYEAHFYRLDATTQRLDYDEILKQAKEVRPKIIIAGASAYSRSIDFARFRKIADEVGAYLMVDMAHIAGLVAAGLHMSPMPYADIVTTTTHKTLRGPRGGLILWNNPELSVAINKSVFPGSQGGPLEHIIAAKAVAFQEALQEDFRKYQQQVLDNTKALASTLIEGGFHLVSGGSDNHLLLLDLSKRSANVSGKDFEHALEEVAMTLNKNTVPNEKRSPFVTSGVRIGTPAVTSRGMKEEQMREIGSIINETFNALESQKDLSHLRQRTLELSAQFPLYPRWDD